MCVNSPGDRVQFQVESHQRLKKWYLIPHCLTLSIIRYWSWVKWENPGNGVAPSPTPQCSSYWKGSLGVTLDSGRQLYFLLSMAASSTIFWVFGMTWLGIEPRSPGPLENTLTTMPIDWPHKSHNRPKKKRLNCQNNYSGLFLFPLTVIYFRFFTSPQHQYVFTHGLFLQVTLEKKMVRYVFPSNLFNLFFK